ncbi:hypothetical protein ACJRO7_016676 [Eucalyptus globulus]|uniref:Uncharacterized protein n=1 Tax=Eucalyptus globulus TaxID=34317 RepID=A0ABD3L8X4_EUCGL
MEALPVGGNGRSLTFSSLLVALLLVSQVSSLHSSDIGASTIAAAAAGSSLCNYSHGLTISGDLIADNMGLEYLIDSPHIPSRTLASAPPVTYATNDASHPAGCRRPPQKGKPYRPCTPQPNPGRPCGTYERTCQGK